MFTETKIRSIIKQEMTTTTKYKTLLRELANDDFACSQCKQHDKCPVYNCTFQHTDDLSGQPCNIHTYNCAASQILAKLGKIPCDVALGVIVAAKRLFVKLAAMPLNELAKIIADMDDIKKEE